MKTNSRRANRKLSLSRETVRSLDAHDLHTATGAFGGLWDLLTGSCTLGASCGPLCPGPYTGN